MPSELVVIETETSFQVAWADDLDDWVATFSKKPGFPARQWAERMVYLYEHVHLQQGMSPPKADTDNANRNVDLS